MASPCSIATPCILFDLDGTLIDGVDDLVTAINIVLHKQALAPLNRDQLEPMLGDGMKTLAWRAFASRGVQLHGSRHDEVSRAFLAAYQAGGFSSTRLLPGAAAALRSLHATGWKIGLASNKQTAPCRQILTSLGIAKMFSAIAGGDAPKAKKPAGEHLRFTLEQMEVNQWDHSCAFMVGDHVNDVLAAREAGLTSIAIAIGCPPGHAATLGADIAVNSYPELLKILGTLLQNPALLPDSHKRPA